MDVNDDDVPTGCGSAARADEACKIQYIDVSVDDGMIARNARPWESQYIPVPEGAKFSRSLYDETFNYKGEQEIARENTQSDDSVTLPDGRWGAYLGNGQMRLAGYEWAEMVDSLSPADVPKLWPSPVASLDPLSLPVQQAGSAARLEWTSLEEQGFDATGSHGTWRIRGAGRWWYLTVQPTYTRGMLWRGKFGSPEEAQARAQSSEDEGEAPRPQQVRATGSTDPTPGSDPQ